MLCDQCLHRPVCKIYDATGGVKRCDHVREATKTGRWEKSEYKGFLRCSCCKDVYINEEWLEDGRWNGCPNCLARLRGTDCGEPGM